MAAAQESDAFQGQRASFGTVGATLIDGPLKEAVTSWLFFASAVVQLSSADGWWAPEDTDVRDTVATGPTKSHDWLSPLPVCGPDDHIPPLARACGDRLRGGNGIVTKREREKKKKFPDRSSLFHFTFVLPHTDKHFQGDRFNIFRSGKGSFVRRYLNNSSRRKFGRSWTEQWCTQQSRYISGGRCFSQLGQQWLHIRFTKI